MRRTRRVLLGTAALMVGLAPAALAGPKEDAKACVRDPQAFGFTDSWGCLDLVRAALGGSDFSGDGHGDGIITNDDVTGELSGTTDWQFGSGGDSATAGDFEVSSLSDELECEFVEQWFELAADSGTDLWLDGCVIDISDVDFDDVLSDLPVDLPEPGDFDPGFDPEYAYGGTFDLTTADGDDMSGMVLGVTDAENWYLGLFAEGLDGWVEIELEWTEEEGLGGGDVVGEMTGHLGELSEL